MMDCARVDQKRIGPGCPSWYLNLQRIRADECAQDASVEEHCRNIFASKHSHQGGWCWIVLTHRCYGGGWANRDNFEAGKSREGLTS